MFGMSGHWELLIVAGIILLLFGKRLPGVMRSLGTSIVFYRFLFELPENEKC